jgi:hypothetical protein
MRSSPSSRSGRVIVRNEVRESAAKYGTSGSWKNVEKKSRSSSTCRHRIVRKEWNMLVLLLLWCCYRPHRILQVYGRIPRRHERVSRTLRERMRDQSTCPLMVPRIDGERIMFYSLRQYYRPQGTLQAYIGISRRDQRIRRTWYPTLRNSSTCCLVVPRIVAENLVLLPFWHIESRIFVPRQSIIRTLKRGMAGSTMI